MKQTLSQAINSLTTVQKVVALNNASGDHYRLVTDTLSKLDDSAVELMRGEIRTWTSDQYGKMSGRFSNLGVVIPDVVMLDFLLNNLNDAARCLSINVEFMSDYLNSFSQYIGYGEYWYAPQRGETEHNDDYFERLRTDTINGLVATRLAELTK